MLPLFSLRSLLPSAFSVLVQSRCQTECHAQVDPLACIVSVSELPAVKRLVEKERGWREERSSRFIRAAAQLDGLRSLSLTTSTCGSSSARLLTWPCSVMASSRFTPLSSTSCRLLAFPNLKTLHCTHLPHNGQEAVCREAPGRMWSQEAEV